MLFETINSVLVYVKKRTERSRKEMTKAEGVFVWKWGIAISYIKNVRWTIILRQ